MSDQQDITLDFVEVQPIEIDIVDQEVVFSIELQEAGLQGADGKDGKDGADGINGTNGIDGADGADGREVLLRTNATHVQWQYVGDLTWNDLILLSSLKGDKGDVGTNGTNGLNGSDGADGADGEQVMIRSDGTNIQWKYASAGSWTNIVALASLKGADGTNGTNGLDGADGIDGKDADSNIDGGTAASIYGGTITIINGGSA